MFTSKEKKYLILIFMACAIGFAVKQYERKHIQMGVHNNLAWSAIDTNVTDTVSLDSLSQNVVSDTSPKKIEGKLEKTEYHYVRKADFSGIVDLNKATAEQLATVPGIGPKTAENIIKYRQINGFFKSLGDLTEVKGIGEKKLEKMKSHLSLNISLPSH